MAQVEQIKEIVTKLEQGVKDLFESDKYADYLRTMSRFYKYSTRNTVLIHLQYPEARRIGGYQFWQNNFNRHVKKGEHGIKIFAPIANKGKEIEVEKIDPNTKLPILDENGQPVMERLSPTSDLQVRFKLVTVFSEQQTEGDPLPELAETLTGDVERYDLFMDALRAVSPLPIEFAELDGADGRCIFGDKIQINTGMSEIQTVCAVVHELVHARLHDKNSIAESGGKPKDRRTEELEAEGCAFSILSYYGVDTSANSFGYAAEWSKSRELKELNASLDTIRKTTAELIDSIDAKYLALAKERGIDLSAIPEKSTPEVASDNKTAMAATTSETASNKKDELTDIQKKTIAIGERLSKLPLQERLNIIARTFGCKTARIDRRLCTGKWRGCSDNYIVLDNDARIGIGTHSTPKAKLVSTINDDVGKTLTAYNPEIVQAIKETATAALKLRETEDNTVAEEKGLKPYKFLNVELNDGSLDANGGYIGWYYVTLAIDNEIFGFTTTGLNYDIADGKCAELISSRNYFVAGGLKDTDVDFVFDNVGHSTKRDLYRNLPSKEALQRAEQTLAQRNQSEQSTHIGRAKMGIEHENYAKFAEMFPDFANQKYSYMRLESDGGGRPSAFEPLSLEWVFGDRFMMMQTYVQNGDLMYDPMIEFTVNSDTGTMNAVVYQNSGMGLYQYYDEDGVGRSVDGNGNSHEVGDLSGRLNRFTTQWLSNLEEQGHLPVRATFWNDGGIDDVDVSVTFDKDGMPIITESDEPAVLVPDPDWTIAELVEYGYTEPDMYPLSVGRAVQLFDTDHTIYLLYPDNTEAMAFDRDEIITFSSEGFCGITKADWEMSPEFKSHFQSTNNRVSDSNTREADLLYGDTDKFGIYQIKNDIDEAHNFRFAPMRELEALGLSVDRGNYELVYTGTLTEKDTLNSLYEKFNIDHPADFTGHSLSVGDVVVLRCNGDITAHFVDSVGFVELPSFTGNERSGDTFSQVGKSSAVERETDTKSIHNEPQMSTDKAKPSILAELEEAQKIAGSGGKQENQKKSERGYE